MLVFRRMFRNSLLTLDIQTPPEKGFGPPKTVLSKWVATNPLMRSSTPSPGHPFIMGKANPWLSPPWKMEGHELNRHSSSPHYTFPARSTWRRWMGFSPPRSPTWENRKIPMTNRPFFHFIKRGGRNSQNGYMVGCVCIKDCTTWKAFCKNMLTMDFDGKFVGGNFICRACAIW